MTKRTRIDLEQEPIDPSFRMHNPGRMREVREQIRYNDLAERALDIVNQTEQRRRDEAHRLGLRTYMVVNRHLEHLQQRLGGEGFDHTYEYRHPDLRPLGTGLWFAANELISAPEESHDFHDGIGLVQRAQRDGRYTGTYRRSMLPAGWRLFRRTSDMSLHARRVDPPPE